MVTDNPTETPPGRITRWHWEKLAKARSEPEVDAILAEVAETMGEGDIEIKVSVSPKQYLRIMKLTLYAFQIKEVEGITSRAFVDRAFQVYEQYLGRLPNALLRKRS